MKTIGIEETVKVAYSMASAYVERLKRINEIDALLNDLSYSLEFTDTSPESIEASVNEFNQQMKKRAQLSEERARLIKNNEMAKTTGSGSLVDVLSGNGEMDAFGVITSGYKFSIFDGELSVEQLNNENIKVPFKDVERTETERVLYQAKLIFTTIFPLLEPEVHIQEIVTIAHVLTTINLENAVQRVAERVG